MIAALPFFRILLDIPDYVEIEIKVCEFPPEYATIEATCDHAGGDEFCLTFNKRVITDNDPTYFWETIAHETVHISQYLTKKLIDSSGTISYWKGEAVDMAKIDYYSLPWEIEAYAMQETLLQEYIAYRRAHH